MTLLHLSFISCENSASFDFIDTTLLWDGGIWGVGF